MIKRTRMLDRLGREIEDEDEDGRVVCPDGGVVSVGMMFMDHADAGARKARDAYERYCDRISNAYKGKRSLAVADAAPLRKASDAWEWYRDWHAARVSV